MKFMDDIKFIVECFKSAYPLLGEKNEQLRKQLRKIEIISIVSVLLIEGIVISRLFFWMPGLLYRDTIGYTRLGVILLFFIDITLIVPLIVAAIYKSKTRDLRQKKSFYQKCISNGLKELQISDELTTRFISS